MVMSVSYHLQTDLFKDSLVLKGVPIGSPPLPKWQWNPLTLPLVQLVLFLHIKLVSNREAKVKENGRTEAGRWMGGWTLDQQVATGSRITLMNGCVHVSLGRCRLWCWPEEGGEQKCLMSYHEGQLIGRWGGHLSPVISEQQGSSIRARAVSLSSTWYGIGVEVVYC